MNQDDFRRWRTNLIKVASQLDACWDHHQDGSDLIVDARYIFDLVQNKVNPLLRTMIREIHEQTGDKKGTDYNCFECGIPKGNGGTCNYCYDIQHEAWDERRKEQEKIDRIFSKKVEVSK